MKKIIITGTSRGIGLEMVKLFAEQGHQVLALSRNEEPVQQLALQNVTTFPFDIQQKEDLESVKSFLQKEWKTVDVLLNNAGKLVNKPFTEISYTELEEVYKVNVFGVFTLSQLVIPFMNTKGHVVTVSSIGGVQGSLKFPGLAAYSSSKGAVITLSELLAEEYKENGPAFNVLALGAVQTEMLEEAFPGYEAPTSAAAMARYITNFALTGNEFYNGKMLQVANSTP